VFINEALSALCPHIKCIQLHILTNLAPILSDSCQVPIADKDQHGELQPGADVPKRGFWQLAEFEFGHFCLTNSLAFIVMRNSPYRSMSRKMQQLISGDYAISQTSDVAVCRTPNNQTGRDVRQSAATDCCFTAGTVWPSQRATQRALSIERRSSAQFTLFADQSELEKDSRSGTGEFFGPSKTTQKIFRKICITLDVRSLITLRFVRSRFVRYLYVIY